MEITGECRICGEKTMHVILWNSKTSFLCAPCARAIRDYDPKLEDRSLTVQIGRIAKEK